MTCERCGTDAQTHCQAPGFSGTRVRGGAFVQELVDTLTRGLQIVRGWRVEPQR
jgi:hypothetical protein